MEQLPKSKPEVFLDKQKAMSLIISALYFPKKGDKAKPYQSKLNDLMNYEHVLFTPLSGDEDFDYFPTNTRGGDITLDPFIPETPQQTITRVQEATRTATFDYRIYEELRLIKKELRQGRAMRNLVKLLGKDGNMEEAEERGEQQEERKEEDDEDDDDFSMSVSMGGMDYGQNREEYDEGAGWQEDEEEGRGDEEDDAEWRRFKDYNIKREQFGQMEAHDQLNDDKDWEDIE
ncbi:hypothetical protein FGO68_gene5637 [Halteria grandinella]|uniref:Uncharacterized protein n=1 Tax=Halteria grandinella TaxID=5974 RepID=A0A8J8NVC1_HALGN|nr:hypothetical protein FGO68_gene5637 [Halteria grandinella]